MAVDTILVIEPSGGTGKRYRAKVYPNAVCGLRMKSMRQLDNIHFTTNVTGNGP